MCLIVFAWRSVPGQRLVLAANRDEFHGRPTRDANWWPDRPSVLAGRDLQAGGTWLGVDNSGRFATVTNYREQQVPDRKPHSRGALVSDFLESDLTPLQFNEGLPGEEFAGFNLLVSDGETLSYCSNRGDEARDLPPGVYGLANASLDTPWPKLVRSRDRLASLIEEDRANETELVRLLADREPAPVDSIADDGLPFELARAVSSPFIVTPEYGTRCSTVVSWDDEGQIRFFERRFDAAGEKTGESRFRVCR